MRRIYWATAVWAGLYPLTSFAQTANAPETVEAQPVPQGYRSAFTGFRVFEEARQPDWAAANERVRTTGGHAGALKESEDEQDEAASAPAHAGHRQ
jgi:hypothetical protein